MILQSFVQALKDFGDAGLLLFMCAGVIVALIVGILPGIGTILVTVLFLPLAFEMSPGVALAFMVTLMSCAITAGSITAILLNIPGETANAATLIDGFPMAQKGQAGRAIGAALMSSAMGGTVSVFFALAMIPMILPMVMAMRSADMVFIILLGLTFIGTLAAGSMIKGLVSGGLGLLVSFIGFQVVTGVPRFTFGSLYLYDGISLIPLALGLFALPEVVFLAISGGTIAKTETAMKGMQDVWEGAKDVFRYWSLWLRSTIIGYIIGVIPGIGTSTAMFVAYGQAKHTSKHPERFGTGSVEGVIAPQSSINAVTGGSLLTTLVLGIPGSAGMAILLGAFLMLGLIPGPAMMREHMDLSFLLLLVAVFSNLIATVICFLTAPYLAKVAYVPSRIIVPLTLVIVLVAAFAQEEHFADVIMTLIFGAIGLGMRKFGFNAPALLVGYVLGNLFEQYFFIAFQADGPVFFLRPISLTLIFIIIALFAVRPVKNLFQRRRGIKTA